MLLTSQILSALPTLYFFKGLQFFQINLHLKLSQKPLPAPRVSILGSCPCTRDILSTSR